MSAPDAIGARESEAPWPDARLAWYSVSVLMLAYTFSYIDRSILALMVGPIREDLGINDTQFSLLQGFAFALFYTILGIPIARLADRSNRRTIITIGVMLWSAMTVLCGFARSYATLFAARVGVGIGEAALSPAAYSMIADLFPKDRLGKALGFYSVGVFLGIGIAYILGGQIVTLIAEAGGVTWPLVGTLQGWQVTFIVVGAPGLLVGLLVLTLTEPKRRHTGQKAAFSLSEAADFIWRRSKVYLPHFVGFSMLTLLFNGILAWAPEFYIRSYAVDRQYAGTAIGLIVIVFGSLGIYAGGVASDYLTRRGHDDGPIRAGLIGAACLTPFAVAAPLMPSANLATLLFCFVLFFASFPFGPAAAAIQIVTPGPLRAQVSAVYLFVVNLTGIGLGATVTALVTDYVFADDSMLRYAMTIVAAISGSLAILILWSAMAPFRNAAVAGRLP